jgi:hypothetical protein
MMMTAMKTAGNISDPRKPIYLHRVLLGWV